MTNSSKLFDPVSIMTGPNPTAGRRIVSLSHRVQIHKRPRRRSRRSSGNVSDGNGAKVVKVRQKHIRAMTQGVSLPSGIGGSEPKDRVCACLGQVAGHELADGFVRSVRDGVGVVVGGLGCGGLGGGGSGV